MKIYNYHPVSRIFLGESLADESPLEPGVYLIPAHATTEPAPDAQEGFYTVFSENNTWIYEPIPVEPEATEVEVPVYAELDPVEKLKIFLASNPDVAELLK